MFTLKGIILANSSCPGEHPEVSIFLKKWQEYIPVLGPAVREGKDFRNIFPTRTFDVYFEPNFIPLEIPARHTVATIPDFSFALHPEWHSRDKILYFKKHFWKKIKRAEKIIVISNYIKEEAINRFKFTSEQIIAIHLGFDREIYKVYPSPEISSFRKNIISQRISSFLSVRLNPGKI